MVYMFQSVIELSGLRMILFDIIDIRFYMYNIILICKQVRSKTCMSANWGNIVRTFGEKVIFLPLFISLERL